MSTSISTAAPKLRQSSFDDYPQIARLQAEHGLGGGASKNGSTCGPAIPLLSSCEENGQSGGFCRRALTLSGIKEIFPFSMNVDCDQRAVAQKFFTPTRAETDAINGEPFQEGKTSAPVLRNFSAYVECRVRRIITAEGDHAIILMEVLEAECRTPVRPLTIRESPWEYGG